MRHRLVRRLATLAVAGTGVVVFVLLHLPLPFLFGPMAACLLAALAGVPLLGMGQISVAARTILGVAIGASVTPEVLGRLPHMAATVVMVPVYILVIGLIGVPFFRRVCGLDSVTSYYAAMPGGLQDMVIFGEAAGADVRTLSLIHATRVLIIVTVVPIVLSMLYGVTLNRPIGALASSIPARELGLMAVAALVGWKGGERIGLFGASILGPMIVAAALSLAGVLDTRPPKEAIVTAQFFIGTGIGIYYVGVTLRELRRTVVWAVAYVLVLAALAALLTEAATLLAGAHPVDAFLAFAPGGQAEMTVLSIVAGADLGFVITHHLTRIVLVITGAPVVARLMRVKQADA